MGNFLQLRRHVLALLALVKASLAAYLCHRNFLRSSLEFLSIITLLLEHSHIAVRLDLVLNRHDLGLFFFLLGQNLVEVESLGLRGWLIVVV